MNDTPYASAMGSLMYGMVCTRADLGYSSSLVARFMSNPGRAHQEAIKWILRYVSNSTKYGLIYGRDRTTNPLCLIGYVDSDYTGDFDKR